jgi:TRAP-type C4-dicarboxylate transport system substrate-binding protein
MIGDKQFQEMPQDLQVIFMEAAKDMQHYEHQLFLENEVNLRENLENKGMTFIEVDNFSFRQIGSKAVYQSLSQDMKEIYNKIIDIE